jgi:hypothetical protein
MPRQPTTSFRLPQRTLDQIAALRMDLDANATDVLITAIDRLWQWEIGPTSERDIYAELDELRARLDALAQPA